METTMRDVQTTIRDNFVPGVDFLTDYYAVLGVARDATPEQIHEAFRAHMRENHPDRVATMAPEFRTIADRNTRIITEAKEVLEDPIRRVAYDATLAAWRGPISQDGVSFRGGSGVPKSETFRVLSDASSTQALLTQVVKAGQDISNFDADMLETLREAATKPDASDRMKDAYRKALAQQDEFLLIQQAKLEEVLGLEEDEALFKTQGGRLERTDRRITAAREQMNAQADVLLIEMVRDDVRLLTDHETPSATAIEERKNALATTLRTDLTVGFESVAARLHDVAAQRDAVCEQRLALLRLEYVSEARDLPQLVLIFSNGDQEVILAIALMEDGKLTNVKKPPPPYDGWSVARVKIDGGLDSMGQLETAAALHFQPLLPDDRDADTTAP